MLKPSSIVRVPTSLDGFFRNWLIFLRPYHELTDRQIDIAAAFLKARYELGKVITDDTILDDNVMSDKTKQKIREECKITLPHFQVMMGDLRKHKFIIDGKINPRYIPNITGDNPTNYSLMLYFTFE